MFLCDILGWRGVGFFCGGTVKMGVSEKELGGVNGMVEHLG